MRARTLAKRLGLLACRCVTHQVPQRPVILAYHSVGGHGGIPGTLFARQMDYVAERFRVVLLRDLASDLAGDPPDAAVCVTFDDGDRGQAEVALPILEARGILATFFLIPPRLRPGPAGAGDSGAMDISQARELATLGHEIGAHTLTHPRLTRVSTIQARREIDGSRRELEDALSVGVTSFAYPKGDHDTAVRSIVADCGYRVAVTVREGLVGSDPDWLALPRICALPSDSMSAFRCKLHPGIDLYERLVGRS